MAAGVEGPEAGGRLRTADRWLGMAIWANLAVILLVFADQGAKDTAEARPLQVLVTLLMYLLVLSRLLVVAVRSPAERPALVMLAAAYLAWSGASAFVSLTTDPEAGQGHLSPVEVGFLLAYLGFVTFLLLDARGGSRITLAVLLEARPMPRDELEEWARTQ